MARPTYPSSYRCFSYRVLIDDLSESLEKHIKANNLTAAQISKYYPSVRDAHIRKIRCGNGHELGIKMLFSIAEASGLKAKVEFAA